MRHFRQKRASAAPLQLRRFVLRDSPTNIYDNKMHEMRGKLSKLGMTPSRYLYNCNRCNLILSLDRDHHHIIILEQMHVFLLGLALGLLVCLASTVYSAFPLSWGSIY